MCYCTPERRTPLCPECAAVLFNENTRLKEELASLRQQQSEPTEWLTGCPDCGMPPDQCDCPDEQSESERDAARYRWLRDQHNEQTPVAAVVWKKGSIPQSALWCNLINADDLDKHIDAAMEGKK